MTKKPSPGAELAALRHLLNKICPGCGNDYIGYNHSKACPKCSPHQRYLRWKTKRKLGE